MLEIQVCSLVFVFQDIDGKIVRKLSVGQIIYDIWFKIVGISRYQGFEISRVKLQNDID